MKMYGRTVLMLAALAALCWLPVTTRARQNQQKAEVALKNAMEKETVEGKFDAAIEQYKKIVETYKNNHEVAAKALLRMAQCYEKLGNAEATKQYERIVREYADQKEMVAEAQKHLAARPVASESERVERQLQFNKGELVSLSADGRYWLGIGWGGQGAGLLFHDAANGQTREFLRLKYADGDLDWAILSPDGSRVVFGQGGELREISVQGSGLRTLIARKAGQPILPISPIDWSRDGQRVLVEIKKAPKNFDLAVVSLPDASVKTLKAGSPVGFVNYGSFSPDGKYIAYAQSNKSGIFLISQDGSRETPVIQGPARYWSPLWAGNDRLLFLSDRSGSQDLWAIGIADGKPIGEAEQIKRNIFAHHAFTSDGAYYYSNYEVQMNVYVADLDITSGRITSQPKRVNERYVGLSKGPYAWSPDGRYLAYARKTNPNDPPASFVIHSMLNGAERELPIRSWLYPVWLPDGRSIATLGQDDGKTSLRRVDVQTGEVLASVNLPATNLVPAALAADAKTFFYSRIETDAQGNSLSLLIAHDIERGTEKELFRGKAQGSGWLRGITDISPSPDGCQVAFKFSVNESEKSAVPPYPAKRRLMSVSADGGSPRVLREYAPEGGADRMITWTKDGRNVISVEVIQNGQRQIVAYPLAGGAPQPSGPVMFLIWELKVSPDGSRIAFSGSEPKGELWVVRNLLAKTNPARK